MRTRNTVLEAKTRGVGVEDYSVPSLVSTPAPLALLFYSPVLSS